MDEWVLYIFHFHKRLKHAYHYTGITKDIKRREQEHITGKGSPLVKAFIDEDIDYELRVMGKFPNYSEAKEKERRKKNSGGARKYCPICKEER